MGNDRDDLENLYYYRFYLSVPMEGGRASGSAAELRETRGGSYTPREI